jgi:hypothetical protein
MDVRSCLLQTETEKEHSLHLRITLAQLVVHVVSSCSDQSKQGGTGHCTSSRKEGGEQQRKADSDD